MPKWFDRSRPAPSTSLSQISLTLLGVGILDACALLALYLMIGDGSWQLAAIVASITVLINAIWLHPNGYPLRWMSPGLSFMVLVSIFPVLLTIYYAFTNFGTGHILTKDQAVAVFEQQTYLPENAILYDYTVFQNPAGEYGLWLKNQGHPGFFAIPGAVIAEGIGSRDAAGIPATVGAYTRLTPAQALRASISLGEVKFGQEPASVQVTTRPGKAAQSAPRYTYDAAAGQLLDHRDGIPYHADDRQGVFVAEDGKELIPGYQVVVGTGNFTRFLNTPSFRTPLLAIFIWTFAYAGLTVFIAFTFGLAIALFFGRNMPFSRLIKSLFIIPFAIPSVLTILVWKGLLNPLNGILSTSLAALFHQPVGWPPVFSDPLWVKAALILVNVWLAYPYFMLINSGALQAIPTDIYEAADIDGASAWQKFRFLTLPLLLVGVGPLLIGSFIANFNSFNTIYLFNEGGPPMVGTATPAGHSDILLSYVFRLAFGSGGQDFGYASAITMIIFVILLFFTLIQFRYMRIWEGVGENV